MLGNMDDDPGNLDRLFNRGRRSSPVDIKRFIAANRPLDDLFKLLITRLGRFFTINRGLLTFYDDRAQLMRITHCYENGVFKSGIGLNIPAAKSMMYQVMQQGYPVADNYPEKITQNIIEKKLIIGPTSRSALIIPLISDTITLGVAALASHNEFAFGPYLEGVGEGITSEFCGKTMKEMLIYSETVVG